MQRCRLRLRRHPPGRLAGSPPHLRRVAGDDARLHRLRDLLLVRFWHYTFFRRYGLQWTAIAILNGILLFLVLFFVYPPKFLFTLVVDQAMGRGEMVTLGNGSQVLRIEPHQSPTLLATYGAGYLAVTVTFAILYAYAYRDRAALELNRAETMETWASLERHLLMGGIGLLSILIALLGGESAGSVAGLTYLLLGPVLSIHGITRGRQYRAAVEH